MGGHVVVSAAGAAATAAVAAAVAVVAAVGATLVQSFWEKQLHHVPTTAATFSLTIFSLFSASGKKRRRQHTEKLDREREQEERIKSVGTTENIIHT